MRNEQSKPLSEDAEIEQDIRAHRKFTLAEAIGRMGGDLLKGVSPITGKRQAELAIEHYLRKQLPDAEGALLVVLQRRVKESEILMKNYEQPFEVLFRVVKSLLDSEERLRRFVGQVDTEWGRLYSERPYFEFEGRLPHPQDPYTLATVRAQLVGLLVKLNRSTPDPE